MGIFGTSEMGDKMGGLAAYGTPEQAATIRHAIEQGETEKLPQIINIVRETGALEATQQAAAKEAQRAISALSSLPSNSYTEGLLQLAAQLLQRRN